MIHFDEIPLEKNEKKLISFLEEHQVDNKKIAPQKPTKFSLAAFDGDQYIGGVTADNWMNTAHVSLLAIDPAYRKKGIGSKLLTAAEHFAKEQGAEIITIHTQDYQAKSFYELFGYSIFGKLEDSPFKGTTKYYLQKRIN